MWIQQLLWHEDLIRVRDLSRLDMTRSAVLNEIGSLLNAAHLDILVLMKLRNINTTQMQALSHHIIHYHDK